MKIEQIEQIMEIAKTGSLNKAAKNLYITQPNLSMSLKNLENELNVKIFERSQKGMELTELGKQLIYYAEPIYQQFLIMPEVFLNIVKNQKVTLTISSAYMKFVANMLSDTINKLSKERFFVKYLECPPEEVIENVATQKSDIGIIYFTSIQKHKMYKLFEYKNLTYTKLMEDGLKIYFSKKNSLYHSNEGYFTTEMFGKSDYPIIIYDSPHTSELIETIKLNLCDTPRLIVVNNRGSMLDLLRNTDAVCIGTTSTIPYQHTEFYQGLKILPIKDLSFFMEIGWIKRNDFVINSNMQYFVDRLTEITVSDEVS